MKNGTFRAKEIGNKGQKVFKVSCTFREDFGKQRFDYDADKFHASVATHESIEGPLCLSSIQDVIS